MSVNDGELQKSDERLSGPRTELLRSTRSEKWARPPQWLFLAFGVVFPIVVLLVELTTRMCAVDLFDPIPTVWHVVLILLVPAANLAIWVAGRTGNVWSFRALGMANGIAMGVSFFYALLFLPVLPLAVLAIMFLGLGFLPMAPIFSFIAGIRGHYYLRNLAGARSLWKVPGTALGLGILLTVVLLLELPGTLTQVALSAACSTDPETRKTAIQVLRAAGSRNVMLRACYLPSGRNMAPIGSIRSLWSDPVSPEKAKEMYFRVTGVPYNAVPAPPGIPRWGAAGPVRAFDADPDVGGARVGGAQSDLSLAASRIDGSVDADAALAYVEWTLEFRNDSPLDQEARAQIGLPHGSVVSRVTLWVNGEEREAAFAGRGKATEAYKKVVRKRRDPLLVTTCGPDRVLVQCFPIPPQGGTMRLRLGMTVPLILDREERALLQLPRFVERNFRVGSEPQHLVWIESRSKVRSGVSSLTPEQPSSELYAVRGTLTENELAGPGCLIEAERSRAASMCWAEDPSRDKDGIVLQTIRQEPANAPEAVVVVVDGSQSLARPRSEVAETIARIPAGIKVSAVIAGDDLIEIPGTAGEAENRVRQQITARLAEFPYAGGCDNVPALARAWDIASGRRESVILWIHGTQPVLMQSVEVLRQKWERRPGGPRLYSIQTSLGPDRVLEKLDGLEAVRPVPRLGALTEDLDRLFSRWRQKTILAAVRERIEKDRVEKTDSGKKTSAHLVRLWAKDEVARLGAIETQQAHEDAIELATAYHLVTPVSGGVVLENQQQYDAEGLTPASRTEVPAVPEPETWAMIVIALALVLWAVYRRRHLCVAR
ncbi:MAG: hypothetical protein HY914_03180 [Desulfomonile tiedjei]|nr:hypothetical protein [Desulfomonile tiedjei]